MKSKSGSKDQRTTDEILSGIEKILGEMLIEMRGKRDIMSIKDVASLYDVSERSVRRLIDDNPIVAVRINGLGMMIDIASLKMVIHEALAERREKVEFEQQLLDDMTDHIREEIAKRRKN